MIQITSLPKPTVRTTEYRGNLLMLTMMRKRNMNNLELSELSEIHKCSISRYLNGLTIPKRTTVMVLCKALKCEPEDIGF